MTGRGPLVVGLLLVGVNLRIAIAAVSPVLTQIQATDHLTSVTAGLLTTDPVICFGLFAFVTPALVRRWGLDRLISLTLVGLTAGIVVRLGPDTVALFAGTTIAGASIGVANVTLPALVKRDFPDRVAVVTGLYAMALSMGAAIAAGLTVPLAHALGSGWRPTIALWAVPAAAGLALWVTVRRGARHVPTGPPAGERRDAGRRLRRDPLAWAVSAFMGLQSLSFYASLAWIPTILEHAGLSATAAGAMLSLSAVVAIGASASAPLLARRSQHPWTAAALAIGACAAGFLGLAAFPAGGAAAWMVLLGLGQGASIALALGVIGLRSADAAVAGQLSTMAQGSGYLVAALGPVGLGVLHDLAGGWAVPLVVLTLLLAPQLAAAVIASRPHQVLAGGAASG